MSSFEDVREKYKPDHIRALFVGESRPIRGAFFYDENSDLYKYTKQAFEDVTARPFNCKQFKEYGCWLYDVCNVPVNHMPRLERKAQIERGIPAFMSELEILSPEFVFLVKKGDFSAMVYPHIQQSGYMDSITCCSLPFPAWGQRQRYVSKLSEMLQKTLFQCSER